jgi:hypothetical protein
MPLPSTQFSWYAQLVLSTTLLFSCSVEFGATDRLDPERRNVNVIGSYIHGTWVCINIPEEEGGPPKFKERLRFLRGSDKGQVIIQRSTDSPGDATKTDGYTPSTYQHYEICQKGYTNSDSFYWIIHMPWEGSEILTFGSEKTDLSGVLSVRRKGPRFKGDYVRP